jgi:hypothetical protein
VQLCWYFLTALSILLRTVLKWASELGEISTLPPVL